MRLLAIEIGGRRLLVVGRLLHERFDTIGETIRSTILFHQRSRDNALYAPLNGLTIAAKTQEFRSTKVDEDRRRGVHPNLVRPLPTEEMMTTVVCGDLVGYFG